MAFEKYLNKFQKVADQLDKKLLDKKQIEVAVGVVFNSAFLKMYKRSWANQNEDLLTSPSRIFFSVWINDRTISEQKIFYNIHALKLRQLRGYSIESRKFADRFRASFKKFQYSWENVSVKFRPLTLMEGWKKFSAEKLESIIVSLAKNFSEIDYLIDETLKTFETDKTLFPTRSVGINTKHPKQQ